MHKAATINARIESRLKGRAEIILHTVGLTSAEAVRLFYMQVCLNNGLPFAVKIPNKETIKALHAANKRKTHKVKTVDKLFEEALGPRLKDHALTGNWKAHRELHLESAPILFVHPIHCHPEHKRRIFR